MKKRFLFDELYKYLNHKNALIITGMRQVGKTTLMKQVFESVNGPKLWYDFENPLDMLHFENIDYDAIYELLKSESGSSKERLFVFIDEIQNYPEITKIIKYHIDKYNVKYIVTGSSNYYLKNLFPESLSGRKFLFIMQPLSFNEYLFFNDKIEKPDKKDKINFKSVYSLLDYKKYEVEYSKYLEFGGFPEVVITRENDLKRLILKNIFASFFEKDIKILSDMKDIREIRDLILMLVPRTGNILDVTKLSNELGINRVKVYNYLELLQGTFFLKLIPKYSKSIDRTVAGGRKVYFSDTGLLNIIGKVNEGQLFENAIANQLSFYGDLFYYNKRNITEIDFVLNKEIALEVKLKASVSDLNKLAKNATGLGIKEYYLVSKNFTDTQNTVFPMFI
ncbi:MAG: ATP-binding protein [Ignavibacteriaceae bacterium]|jgi:predicted AAA+ superfamily ATPase|nr:ATP-binding protein [Ignavibacteriaceae bacterium]